MNRFPLLKPAAQPAVIVSVAFSTPDKAAAAIAQVPLAVQPAGTSGTAGDIAAKAGADAAGLDDPAAAPTADQAGADILEWRVDSLLDRSQVAGAFAAVARSARAPVLLTMRSGFEGGAAQVSEAEYARVVKELIELAAAQSAGQEQAADAQMQAAAPEPADGAQAAQPECLSCAVDIEISRTLAPDLLAHAQDLGVATVASYHDFHRTPNAYKLIDTFHAMQLSGADIAKIAVMPQTTADVITLLSALDAARTLDIPVIGISMGKLGASTRLMAGEFGSAATFAAGPAGASAPGQVTIAEVREALSILSD